MKEKCENKEKCELSHEKENKICETIEIMPLVDIIEEDHGMTMIFEIPGASSEDVCVEVTNHVLNVEAKSSLCRRGRAVVFRRCFQLNSNTDTANISAKTKDGLLTLTLPKSESAKTHKIKVTQ